MIFLGANFSFFIGRDSPEVEGDPTWVPTFEALKLLLFTTKALRVGWQFPLEPVKGGIGRYMGVS